MIETLEIKINKKHTSYLQGQMFQSGIKLYLAEISLMTFRK